MNNTCVICGSKFQSDRRARFCPDKPGCRQKYNRQERTIKALGETISEAIGNLISAEHDPNHWKLANETLMNAEKEIIRRLDEIHPERHPPKEVTARPIRINNPLEGEKYYVFDPQESVQDMIAITAVKRVGGWLEGTLGDNRWDKVKVSMGCTFIQIIEPETDQLGREVMDRYNTGWGAVKNPDRQIEIAPVPPADDDYSFEEEDE